jgi:hypothetical protein
MSEERPAKALKLTDADQIQDEFDAFFEDAFNRIDEITGLESISHTLQEMIREFCRRLDEPSLIFLLKNNLYTEVSFREKINLLESKPFSDDTRRFGSVGDMQDSILHVFHVYLEMAIGERLEELLNTPRKDPESVPARDIGDSAMGVIE